MREYTVQMSDGVKITVNAFNEGDALRTAERRMRNKAFGSTAIKVIEVLA